MESKHRFLVLKARSKLERDSWCWALNAELERLARVTKEREINGRTGEIARILEGELAS